MDVHRMKIVYILVVIVAYFANRWYRTPNIPEHLLNHPATFVPNLIEEDAAKELLELVKGMHEFPTNLNDLNFYDTVYEHIGEAQKIESDGKCADPFLVPNKDGSLCILPGRIDVAKHFMKYGGVEGKKEKFEVAASRLLSFGRYIFDLTSYPIVEKLFASEKFLHGAKSTCPPHKQILDPFQFNFIIQVPGQSVALHLDAVYFLHATRFEYPMWLLSVMAHSGLYKEEFIDQVQVVGYVHKWEDSRRGGKFVYYLNNSINAYQEEPLPRAGSFVDGSKIIHAATIYYPDLKPPIMDKSAENKLVYQGQDKWTVTSNGKTLKTFKTDDLRITIVYRARCFESEEKKAQFSRIRETKEDIRPVDEILEDLKKDLHETRGYSMEKLNAFSRYDLGMILLDEYIKYPLPPHGLIPVNYCLADRFYPWLKPILDRIC
ncbi:unnamed protein product, partial [Mesorhabditis belari]|uniref:Uncharacterized protein n=1 Tax=Mesorhabditis belari TaxID=2138241 RepID=A0AAF3EGS7_9BILA